MNTFINFILFSSANSNKLSLSIKAGIPFVVAILALFNVNVDINPIADQLILVLNTLFALVAGAVTLFGLLRKVYLTWKGENEVLK